MQLPGWEWAAPALITLFVLWRRGAGLLEICWALAPGAFWLALFVVTGDRRLYFCYTMLYAVQLARLFGVRGRGQAIGVGSVVIAAFLAIRIWQDATAAVLLVELLVAAGVLALGVVWRGGQAESPAQRAVLSLAASLAAFAGLAL